MHRDRTPPQVSCDGKDKLTASQARTLAKRLVGGVGSAYHCVHCKSWHVGHASRKANLLRKRPRFYDEDGGEGA